jgi:formate hydrogenlyase transcriptional activator
MDEVAEQRYKALLGVSQSICAHTNLGELLRELSTGLRKLVYFDVLTLVLYNEERGTSRLHLVETDLPLDFLDPTEKPASQTPAGLVMESLQPYYWPDFLEETRFPFLLEAMKKAGGRSLCCVPLITARRKVGALGFASRDVAAYSAKDIEFMSQAAMQVAVAVENTLGHEALARERDRLQLLLEINNAVVTKLETRELLSEIAKSIRRLYGNEYVSLGLYDESSQELRIVAMDFPDSRGFLKENKVIPMSHSPSRFCIESRKPQVYEDRDLEEICQKAAEYIVLGEGLRSFCTLPLVSRDRVLGTFNVASRKPKAFCPEDVDLLNQVACQVAIALDNSLSYEQIQNLKNKLAEEKLYLEEEIRTEHQFEEIIGQSEGLRRVLQQVETVAPTGSTVLILGETGTGKELIARAIHDRSTRSQTTFVKLNCAAIPTGLIESELLGHERGAFTGAIAQKVGRFELAHKGTLFLDEIGEIPLEIQPKLLRVLQEKEFERLGGTRTIHSDVRLVAATNRDLQQMVNERQFRPDLFYRLNVFPITVPPLRERQEDVPLLVRYFVQMFSRRMNRQITSIASESMEALTRYPWPGNIRELQNFIERAVILTRGGVLNVSTSQLRSADVRPAKSIGTLETVEREHILTALEESGWVIGGPKGAATRLGLKRTTLQSRMEKLGIVRGTRQGAAVTH